MPREQDEALAQRLEKAIERIKGITTAKVVLHPRTGAVEEIHLIGLPTRRPKQIVRDIESLLYVQFGMQVDYRKISFVPLSEDATSARLRLQFVVARPHPAARDQMQVVLQDNNARYEGRAPLPGEAPNGAAVSAVAQATVGAVQQAIGDIARLTAQEAQIVLVDGSEVCLVVVQVRTPQGDERLTGTCIVRACPFEATARATLDAMNRRLPIWTLAHAVEMPRGSAKRVSI